MPVPDASGVRAFSTTAAPVQSRLALWEEYNELALFGLRCSTLSERSLVATQSNLELPRLRLTHIQGNDHVIERAPQNIRRNPVDAVMLCLLLEGNAFFYHEAGCETLSAGEAVVYDPNRPFMYGFSTDMRQVIVEVPRTVLREDGARDEYLRPRVLRIAGSPTAAHARTAASAAIRAFKLGQEGAAALEESVLGLFNVITGKAMDPPSQAYLATAREFIDARLGQPDLSAARIARAVGISERHLARIFAAQDTTPARFVHDARLARARELLAAPGFAHTRIGEVSVAVGFVSTAHFSRAFRRRYGCTPTEFRSDALGTA
ncbi:AraC family transcriptional regulator [Zafaria cholistanensis]|nr:AraC family transcriptional regulator [Zafaria cholistanensis]